MVTINYLTDLEEELYISDESLLGNTPYEMLYNYLDNDNPTTFRKKELGNDNIQHLKKSYRSFTDLFILIKTTYPDVTLEEFSFLVIKLLDNEEQSKVLYCQDIDKVVFPFFSSSMGTIYEDGANEDYDKDYDDKYSKGASNISFNDILELAYNYSKENNK